MRLSDPLLVLDEGSKMAAAQFEQTFGSAAPLYYYYFGPLVPESRKEWTGRGYSPVAMPPKIVRCLLRITTGLIRWLARKDIRVIPDPLPAVEHTWLVPAERATLDVAMAAEARSLTLTTDKGQYTGPGGVVQDRRGEVCVLLSLQALPPGGPDALGDFRSLMGLLEDGAQVHADVGLVEASTQTARHASAGPGRVRVALGRVHLSVAPQTTGSIDELVVELTNARIAGKGQGRWSDGRFEIERIEHVPWHSQLSTDRALRVIVRLDQAITDTESIELRIQNLVSIALRAKCSVGYVERRCQGSLVDRFLQPAMAVPSSTRPMVDYFAKDLASFIEACDHGYRVTPGIYDLPVLIDYYLKAHSEPTIELKLIAASVFMESFKFMWAMGEPGLVIDRKGNGLVREFKEQLPNGKLRRLSFEELLKRAAASLGVPNPTYAFLDNRNALFHTGVSAPAQLGHAGVIQALQQDFEVLADQMDDILLRLLSFQGDLYRFSAPDALVTFP